MPLIFCFAFSNAMGPATRFIMASFSAPTPFGGRAYTLLRAAGRGGG
jgi:hypothetical protein